MDAALTLDFLVPGAKYLGSLVDNTQTCFEDIIWLDERPKPTCQEMMDSAEEAAITYYRNNLECTPLQLRRALRVTGDYPIVAAMMAQASEESVEAWEHAITIYRMDPIVVGLIAALERSPEEADQLFEIAKTF